MRKLTIAVVVASVALVVAATVLAVLERDATAGADGSMGVGVLHVGYPIAVSAVAAAGALVASRRRRHPVAWCFLLATLSGEALLAPLNYGTVRRGDSPESARRAHPPARRGPALSSCRPVKGCHGGLALCPCLRLGAAK